MSDAGQTPPAAGGEQGTPAAPPASYPPAQQTASPQQAYPQQGYPQQGYPQQAWSPAPARWQPPTYGDWEDAHGPATTSGALRRAFAGVPARELLLDAAAAALLVVSLSLPWDVGSQARWRLDVLAVTLLAIAALAVPYLARGRAFGTALDARRAALVRVLAVVPYLVTVVAYFVVDLVAADVEGIGGFTQVLVGPAGGIDSAVALGLAGAVLAMRPRAEELRGWPGLDRHWLLVPAVLAGLAVVWSLGSLLRVLASDELEGVAASAVVVDLLLVLVGPAVLVLGVVGLLRRDEGWRLAIGAVAAAPILLGWVGSLLETVHVLTAALVLWPAVAASAWAARRAMRVSERPWGDATARVLTLAVVVGGVDLLVSALALADVDDTARWVTAMLLALAYVAAAAAGLVLLRAPRQNWVLHGLALAGALLVLGVIGLMVVGDAGVGGRQVDELLALPIPVVVAAFVLAQASREGRGVPRHPALADAPRPAPAAPPAPPAPPANDAVQMAQDPATPQATLADLATRVPETRVHIARHPAAYPALLDWLAALGDPEVTRAVEERRASGA